MYLLLVLECVSFLNVYEICIELKSGIRITCNFSTIQKPYFCIYSVLAMDGPSDAMKHEKFGGAKNFHRW
jgi:hypothetical protein